MLLPLPASLKSNLPVASNPRLITLYRTFYAIQLVISYSTVGQAQTCSFFSIGPAQSDQGEE